MAEGNEVRRQVVALVFNGCKSRRSPQESVAERQSRLTVNQVLRVRRFESSSAHQHDYSGEKAGYSCAMLVLGLILLLAGILLAIPVLVTVGVVLIIVGAVFLFVRPGGRYWY